MDEHKMSCDCSYCLSSCFTSKAGLLETAMTTGKKKKSRVQTTSCSKLTFESETRRRRTTQSAAVVSILSPEDWREGDVSAGFEVALSVCVQLSGPSRGARPTGRQLRAAASSSGATVINQQLLESSSGGMATQTER